VPVDHPDIADQRSEILAPFPPAKALISFVCRMNRENIRSPMRSIANLEFRHTTDTIDEITRHIVRALDAEGIRAMTGAAAGFPMEADRWKTGRIWVASHKPIAVAAGLAAWVFIATSVNMRLVDSSRPATLDDARTLIEQYILPFALPSPNRQASCYADGKWERGAEVISASASTGGITLRRKFGKWRILQPGCGFCMMRALTVSGRCDRY
jgi:hypothetical protein